MAKENIENWMYGRIAQLIGATPDEIEPDDSIHDIGLQSILLMQLLDALKAEYGIAISYIEAMNAPTLGSLVSLARDSSRISNSINENPPTRLEDTNEEKEFDLSVMAHAYWAGRQDVSNDGGTPPHFYHEFTTSRIDANRLDKALSIIVERHPMLRAAISSSGKQRILAKPYHHHCVVHDFREDDEDLALAHLQEVRASLVNTSMDIEQGEVLDVHVIHLPDQSILSVLLDMSVSDARSFRILLSELAHYYNNPSLKPPRMEVTYRDYIEFTKREDPEKEGDRLWWLSKLPTLPRHPLIPLDPSKKVLGMRSYRLGDRLEPKIRKTLEDAAKSAGVTLTALLMSAFCYCIRTWSENEQFLLNVPVFNRPAEIKGIEDVIGDFTGSVLLACSIDTTATFFENCRILNRRLAEALSHRQYPGVSVLRDLSQHHGEAFRAPFVFTSAMGIGELFSDEFKKTFGRPSWIVSHSPYTWLDVQLGLVDGDLHINWDIRKGVFAEGVIEEIYDSFKKLLLDISSHAPADFIAETLIPASQLEARRLRKRTADERAALRSHSEGLLQDGLEIQARIRPNAIAIYESSGQTTFASLFSLSKTVAAAIKSAGISPGSRIGICMPKSACQVAGVYGILLAGCCYVPVSPRIPEIRKKTIAREADLAAVITQHPCSWFKGPLISIPTDNASSEGFESAKVQPSSPAYVIFTSGSTGEPKGVVVSHEAALNTIQDIQARFSIGAHDIALGVSNLDFDLSVFDIFGILGAGATLVFSDQGNFADPPCGCKQCKSTE